MKRLFIFLLLVALVFIPVKLWADATFTSTVTPKSGTLDYISGGGVAITDALTGYVTHVDSDGAASVQEKAQTIAVSSGATLNTGVGLVTGAARVSSIIVSGTASTAKDYVLIYDALTATGTAKFDISIGVAGDTFAVQIPGGAIFSTGVFADANASNFNITVTYDN